MSLDSLVNGDTAMRELVKLAESAGFTLRVHDWTCATLVRGEWERKFSQIETLRDFLRAALAGARLRSVDYVTSLDNRNFDYAWQQYASARALAETGAIIYISASGSWSAEKPPTMSYQTGWTSVTAYERIGYHTNTAQLVLGWQDGGAAIIDYRAVLN